MKRALVIVLCFLLTGSLFLFGIAFVCGDAVAPALRENGAAPNRGVTALQTGMIRERVTELAGLYGFSADNVLALLDDGKIGEMTRQASGWWSGILKNGTPGTGPDLQARDLEQALLADPGFGAGAGDEDREILAGEAAKAVRQSVLRVVLPVRPELVGRGLQEVTARIDLAGFVSFLTGSPWALLALSALLAGLIALLESRRLRLALPYIGSAMGGAGLVLLAVLILACCAGVGGLIREASESLAAQYNALANGMALKLGALAAGLLACCVLFIALGRKNGKTNEA